MKASVRFWAGWGIALALAWAAVVWVVLQWNLSNYTQLVADRLVLLAELRRGAVQEYFSTAEAELRFWGSNPGMVAAQQSLVGIWGEVPEGAMNARLRKDYVDNNPNPEGFHLDFDGVEDGEPYNQMHLDMHARARLFVTERGYYDFFLIGPEGDVYYTVEKEADFATNLEQGEWRDSGLAQVYRQAKRQHREGTVVISDMQPYGPSDDAPAIFLATAMHDEVGRFLGVIAFQLPTDRILGIMAYTSGMGETGETYLVGQDFLMRSDSRFSEEPTVLSEKVETGTVKRALAGEQGTGLITDYRGVEVMSAYLPMQVGVATWAVMAEIDQEEIEVGAARERPALAGLLALFYGLSLWSVWYWRGRPEPDDNTQMAALDFSDGEGGGFSD